MSKPKVLIYASVSEPAGSFAALEEAGYQIAIGDPQWQVPGGDHEEAFAAATRDAVALIGTSIRATPITRRVFETAQRLRVIAKYSVGVDDVDTEAATELGIMVCHAPTESNCFGVAEQTIAVMLTILKKTRERDAAIREGRWREADSLGTHVGRRMSDGYAGLTIGIVGLGRIGTRVAQLLAPWRVRLIAYDPYVPPATFLLAGVEPVSYETLLRESDVVSLHVVLTRETLNMMSDAQFALMKPNAVVINTARGKLIDERALARALTSGRIAAAGIDAFEVEPLPADSPLRSVGDKILLSPHAASFNIGAGLGPGIVWAARSAVSALAGEVPDNVYNKDVIPRWKERFGGAAAIG